MVRVGDLVMVRVGDRRDGERGALLVFYALLLVVMLGFAALVVDLGIGRAKRRNAQSGGDAAATAAAGILAVKGGNASATTEAKTYAARNLAESLDWDACTDSPPAGYVSAGSPCITFDSPSTALRVRVRIPIIKLNTLLGGAIGTSVLKVSAVAEAEVEGGPGSTLPFYLPLGGVGSTEVCLKTGSGPQVPPCNGPDTGNFGVLDSPHYGNPLLGTTLDCTPDNKILIDNVRLGIDHSLTVFTGTRRNDQDACSNTSLRPPNNVETSLGNVAQDSLQRGLIVSSGTPGRLARAPFDSALIQTNSPKLDNRPLWKFILPSIEGDGSVPQSCWPSKITKKADMAKCLSEYGGSTTPLFKDDLTSGLQQSLRFSWVPQFSVNVGPGGSASYDIVEFDPVFIESIFFSCSSTCAAQWDVGEPNPAQLPVANSTKAEAFTAFSIPINALPLQIRELSPNPFTARIIHLIK